LNEVIVSISTLEELISANQKLTPMMEQFYAIKKQYIDHILLFRMGDFYEVFFEDAVRASKILNITLTHRGKIGDTPIPMAGIPHHAATTYVDRLCQAGLKVAIGEQVEDPKEAKGIVKRAVTQVISPGLPYDLDKTDSREQHFITSAYKKNNQIFLVALDFTTGEFLGSIHEDNSSFLNKLNSYAPKEFITHMGQWEDLKEIEILLKHLGTLKTHLSDEYFEAKYTQLYSEKLIPGMKRDKTLQKNKDIFPALGALAYYICTTQQLDEFFHIRPFHLSNDENLMKISKHTLEGLEILPRNRETYNESLLGFLDKSQTAMGPRMLRRLLQSPLRDPEEISKRQDIIQALSQNHELLEEMRDVLSNVRDLERILTKVSTQKATSSDLINTSLAIRAYQQLTEITKALPSNLFPKVKNKENGLLSELAEKIEKTINDDIGASLDKGNLIRPGASRSRDRLSKLTNNAMEELTCLEEQYRKKTGIVKLRVKSNNIFGYFIEVSKIHSNKVPKSFERRQTLVNCERYTTTELSEFEKEIVSAKDKLEKLEREIFRNITLEMLELSPTIQTLSNVLASIDTYQSLSWVSLREKFTRPKISTSKEVILNGAWHPLIKANLQEQFISHDLKLNEESYFGLITGPNMAGKTTVMREVAIIQVLSQIGCFVPAKSANVSPCDYLFSRLGASDDILKGQSTFMVEMSETAEIIRHASSQSLIILDEVGRGTSTYDGLSIAWALVEHLVQNTQALGLFATHYHELIDLAERLDGAKNLTVETLNINGDVQFLYRLIEEGASQSFGLYVAKLAGLPRTLLHRSEEILRGLEEKNEDCAEINLEQPECDIAQGNYSGTQLSFFPEPEPVTKVPPYLEKLEEDLSGIDIDKLTPIEALVKLNGLQKGLDSQKPLQ
jgi:DNA mismatch repair protein MutS